jgi:hypothetical protein
MTRDSDGGGGSQYSAHTVPKDRIPEIAEEFTFLGKTFRDSGVPSDKWLAAYREAEWEWKQELEAKKRQFIEHAQAAIDGKDVDPRGWRKWFDNGPMFSDEHPTAEPIPLQMGGGESTEAATDPEDADPRGWRKWFDNGPMFEDEHPAVIQGLAANVFDRLFGEKKLPDALMRPIGDLTEKVAGAWVQGKYAAGGQMQREVDRVVWDVIKPYLEKHGKEIQDKLNELADKDGRKRPFPFPVSNEEFATWYTGKAMGLDPAFPYSEMPDPWNRGQRGNPVEADDGWEERQMPGRGLDREFRREQETLKRRAAGAPPPNPADYVVPFQHVYDQWNENNDRIEREHEQEVAAQSNPALAQRRRNFTE